jgi:hypothetical protein
MLERALAKALIAALRRLACLDPGHAEEMNEAVANIERVMALASPRRLAEHLNERR